MNKVNVFNLIQLCEPFSWVQLNVSSTLIKFDKSLKEKGK